MATSDINGLPQFQGSDPADLESSLNLLSGAVSSTLDGLLLPYKVSGVTARDNLASKRPPTQQNPLLVWRQNVGYFEFNDGGGWRRWPSINDVHDYSQTVVPGPNELIIGGTTYQASGSWAIEEGDISWSSETARPTYGLLYRNLPYRVPSGWRPEVFMLYGPSRYSTVWASGISTVDGVTRVTIKMLQLNNPIKTARTIGWRLTKA